MIEAGPTNEEMAAVLATMRPDELADFLDRAAVLSEASAGELLIKAKMYQARKLQRSAAVLSQAAAKLRKIK